MSNKNYDVGSVFRVFIKNKFISNCFVFFQILYKYTEFTNRYNFFKKIVFLCAFYACVDLRFCDRILLQGIYPEGIIKS